MTTTDTRAALEAAIDAYAQAAIDSGSILGAPYDGPTLSAAWCAVALEVENHVEAEVARRLAAAPDVEVAIVDYALAAQGDFDTSEERDALRAAFAADKARAVEAGISAAFATLLPGRPTPDEARRLVDAFASVVDRLAGFADDPPANRDHYNTQMDRLIADHKDARTALLRALGVEA